jgi:imidazolonepropionase-like amidohydrolase
MLMCCLIAGLAPVLPSVLSSTVGAAQAEPKPLAFRNVRIFDGVTAIPRGNVVVQDGKILAAGSGANIPDGAEVIEGEGLTLIPGLIDSHTHSYGDALKTALVFGVTTELDMFTDYHMAPAIRKQQSEGKAKNVADLFSAGTLVTAPHGHGTEYGLPIPTINGPEEAQAFVDARIAEGSDYIKIIYDDGKTYGLSIPTISKATMAAVVAAAHKRGKLAVAHIGSLQGARDAIESGVDGLAHLFVDRSPEPDFGKFVAAHHAFVIGTMTVLQAICRIPGGESLAADPALAEYILPADAANLRKGFPARAGAQENYSAAEEAVRQLKAAGVPILAGTDAPNPGTSHGASLHLEMELLVRAGLTPAEALASGTSIPAHAFRLADRGRIAPRLRADLLLVKGDPISDIKATRNIVGVWKQGTKLDREPCAAEVRRLKAADDESRRQPARPGSEQRLVSDFEDGKATTKFGAGWDKSTDAIAGGKSVANFTVVAGGAKGSKYSLKITGEIKAGFPYPWAGAIFFPGPQPTAPANLSSKKGISFWTRGDSQNYQVMVYTKSGGYLPASQKFSAAADWKQVTISFASLGGIDGHDIMGIAFAAGSGMTKFEFQIDEVSLY